MPRGQHERARSGGKDARLRHGVTSRRATERRFVTGYVTGVTERDNWTSAPWGRPAELPPRIREQQLRSSWPVRGAGASTKA